MSTNTTSPKAPASRAPDDRFLTADSVDQKWAAIRKIEISSLQFDESCDDNSDPYNSTGRFLAASIPKS